MVVLGMYWGIEYTHMSVGTPLKPRRWFLTPELIQWRYMVECGDYAGPFFSFPYRPWGNSRFPLHNPAFLIGHTDVRYPGVRIGDK